MTVMTRPIKMSVVRDKYLRDLQENYNPQPNVRLASDRYRDGCGKPTGNVNLLAYEGREFGSGRTPIESQTYSGKRFYYHWDRRSDNALITNSLSHFVLTTEAGGHKGRQMNIAGGLTAVGFYTASYFKSGAGAKQWTFKYRMDSKTGDYYKTSASCRVYAYTSGYLSGDSQALTSWVGCETSAGETKTRVIDFTVPTNYDYVHLNFRVTSTAGANGCATTFTSWDWKV